MAQLCRRCHVRYVTPIFGERGLCDECLKEVEKAEWKEREREDLERKERERQEEEEELHRQYLEDLNEEQLEYQRQAAEDAAEARRLAGLTTFTCCNCQGSFNEEQGYSALQTPIGKPVCNKCFPFLKKCMGCNEYFFTNNPKSQKLIAIEYVYKDTGKTLKKEPSNDFICTDCVKTKCASFLNEQEKLKNRFNELVRIENEKKTQEKAEKDRIEAMNRALQKRKNDRTKEEKRIQNELTKQKQVARYGQELAEKTIARKNLWTIIFGILTVGLSILLFKRKTVARNDGHLRTLVEKAIAKKGNNCDLNWIDVSQVRCMSNLFKGKDFNGDISKWDVSNVILMDGMFENSTFNGDISRWNVSNVHNMSAMFKNSKFNGNISNWNVVGATCMRSMFEQSVFTGDISKWKVFKVASMNSMFKNSKFNGNIANWDVSSVIDFESMFESSQFNGDVSNWNVFSGVLFDKMFAESPFSGDVSKWKISLEDKNRAKGANKFVPKSKAELQELLGDLVRERGENCDLNDIDVSNITDMSNLFNCDFACEGCVDFDFNGDISKWDVSNVTNMSSMFKGSKFNGDISKWNVSNVTNMSRMFYESKFNGDISKWNVSKVTDMSCMFSVDIWDDEYKEDDLNPFQGDISKWDVSNVTDMNHMFDYSKFHGDITKWKINPKADTDGMFDNSKFSPEEIKAILHKK